MTTCIFLSCCEIILWVNQFGSKESQLLFCLKLKSSHRFLFILWRRWPWLGSIARLTPMHGLRCGVQWAALLPLRGGESLRSWDVIEKFSADTLTEWNKTESPSGACKTIHSSEDKMNLANIQSSINFSNSIHLIIIALSWKLAVSRLLPCL